MNAASLLPEERTQKEETRLRTHVPGLKKDRGGGGGEDRNG